MVGATLGFTVGVPELGVTDGLPIGDNVGVSDGALLDATIGVFVGAILGVTEGVYDGYSEVENTVGVMLGA